MPKSRETDVVCALPLLWNPGGKRIPLLVGQDCLSSLARLLKPLSPDRILLVYDALLPARYGREVRAIAGTIARVTLLPAAAGEAGKTLATLEALAGHALAAGASRRSCVIALGGGLVCNMAGMLAATLYRGIPLIHVPTTLLAMHDTVTSLKQALNIAGHKNLLGMYHRPAGILCDTRFLLTLPPAAIQASLVEIVKNALVLGGPYIQHARRLTADLPQADALAVIRSGVAAKRSLMRLDPYEKSAAVVFEYGHTVGHAIESCCHGEIGHGQCIYWGMGAAGEIGHAMGFLGIEAYQRHQAMLGLLGTVAAPQPIALSCLLEAIAFDNKRGHLPPLRGHIQMVLLREIGQAAHTGDMPIVQVPLAEVRKALKRLPFVDLTLKRPLL